MVYGFKMKKLIFALHLLLIANFSCKGQYYDSIYIQRFTENKSVFEKTVSCLQTQREAINFTTDKTVVFFDTSLLNNPKYINPVKDGLCVLFASNQFKSISYYSSGEIEFLVSIKKDDFTLTETKRVILFSADKELPASYRHWQKQRLIVEHWWYIENTDAQY